MRYTSKREYAMLRVYMFVFCGIEKAECFGMKKKIFGILAAVAMLCVSNCVGVDAAQDTTEERITITPYAFVRIPQPDWTNFLSAP